MVLRGQPVGEQGAADRWTALDPFRAGRGGAAGDPPRGAPFFLHIVQPRALRGPFSMPRGPGSPRHGRLFRARRFPCPAIKKGPVRAPLAALSTLRRLVAQQPRQQFGFFLRPIPFLSFGSDCLERFLLGAGVGPIYKLFQPVAHKRDVYALENIA